MQPELEPRSIPDQSILDAGLTVPETQSLPIRVGVELLPPKPVRKTPVETLYSGLSWPRLEKVPADPEVSREPERARAWDGFDEAWRPRKELAEQIRLPWNFDQNELAAIRDPYERVTVRLVQELIGEDRRRMRREFGSPVLATRHQDLSYPTTPNYLDQWNDEYEELFFGDKGRSFIRRPARKAIKSFTFFQDMRLAIDALKEDHVPTSGSYQEAHPGKSSFGRISVRVRVRKPSDPVEFMYKRSGLRVGSSQERLRLGYSTSLTDKLSLSLTSRYSYESSDMSLRADLSYRIDDRASAHLAAGEGMAFLASPNAYSLMAAPLDSSLGVLFYVQHLF